MNISENMEHYLISSLNTNSFIRLMLSSPDDKKGELKKVTVRIIELKKVRSLSFLYTYRIKTVTKNLSIEKGIELAAKMFAETFTMCVIFSSEDDHSFRRTKKGSILYKRSKAEHKAGEFSLDHNHKKKRMIGIENNIYLERLGVIRNGKVIEGMSGKFRQINRFIETIDGLLDESGLNTKNELTVYDMGSGKGYLTFAVYDFLANVIKKNVSITGIEFRSDLADLCGRISKECGFSGLNFISGSISDTKIENTDILIALHACDTATDDAIFKGIKSEAEIIIVSPCCHKQIRKQLNINNALNEITRHGILEERLAEMATDSLRALIIEANGYDTKVFEFITDEHTHKNIMITAVKAKKHSDASAVNEKIVKLKDLLGIKRFYLEELFRLEK